MGFDHEAGMHVVNVVYFQPVGRRQHNIGNFRHGTHELVAMDEKVKVHQGGHDLLGVGQMEDLLASHAEPDLDHGVARTVTA